MKVFLIVADDCRIPHLCYRLKKALFANECAVETFNYRAYNLQRFSILNTFVNKQIIRKVLQFKPDLTLVMKGETILPGTIKQLSDAGITTANWSMDNPFGEYQAWSGLKNISEYEHFFIFDSGYMPRLKKLVKNVHWLPCCADTELFAEQIRWIERKPICDISFIGSHMPNREKVLEQVARINVNNFNYNSDYDSNLNLKIWGYRWNKILKTSPLRKYVQRQELSFNKNLGDLKEVCKLHNLSKINLNIHFTHSKKGLNMRAFEIPATNSFQICDWYEELPKLFKEGKEIVSYSSISELKELINYYLDPAAEEERKEISLAGMKRVQKEHTYTQRIKEVLRKIK